MRTQVPAASDTPRSSTIEQFQCAEGCSKKSFGRPYDLTRHINEQHRCPHEDCRNVRFCTPKDKKDHEKIHSKSGLGYRCGTCELDGLDPKALTRAEKLKKHFKDSHGVSGDMGVRDFQCTREGCYLGSSCGGIFFTSLDELNEHTRREHALVPMRRVAPDREINGELQLTIRNRS